MTDNISTIAGAGGGGGCFRKGARIQLEHGKTVAIEELKVGDEILAFDALGDIHVAKVTKCHYHSDPQPILHIKFWGGETFITPNHWVLNQYNAFVEMGNLTIHDALMDGMGHLRPLIDAKFIGYEPVYNLTVEPHHTFIADGIRVHNGGHRERYPEVAGAGGGGGGKSSGSSRPAVEDPDSLQSRAMISIIDLLGEGQIGGLVDGAKSIYLNDTPIQNPDLSFNFSGFNWDYRTGTQDQLPIEGYADVETPFTVGVQVKTTTPCTFSVTNPNADAVRVLTTIPSLISQDTSTGDIHGTSVQYKFSVSTDGGPYIDVPAAITNIVGGTWAQEPVTGSWIATKVPTATYGIGATVYAYGTYDTTGTIKVQPQRWNGTAWENYGSEKTLNVSRREGTSVVGGVFSWVTKLLGTSYIYESDKLYIEAANTDKLRFVVTGKTATYNSYVDPDTGIPVYGDMEIRTSGDVQSLTGTPVVTISGKTRSRYQRAHVIKLPKPGVTWNIRMTRITSDSASSTLSNDTYLDTYVEIVDSKLSYPNSAYIGITIDSSQFNQIPNRAYLVDGLYIQIPSNYDPVARTYSGIWNGTFKTAVSNNPAWIMYDLLTNKRYGLGQFLQPSQIDKAKLYQIGKYCDDLVPDGFGGYEPRFVINTQISGQAEAYRVISDISSCFRGMAYWAGGMAGFTQDAPTDPSMVYSAANVIDGLFTYTGAARKDRHSVALITWNDPKNGYKQHIEYVEDAELVQRYGVRKIDMVAFGCTSRGQAARAGRWLLYTEKYESDMVSFKVGQDSAMVMPGEVVKIHDTTRSGKRMSGRIISATEVSVVLDSAVTLAEYNAVLSIRLPDGSFADRTLINGPGVTSVLHWSSPLTVIPDPNAIFIVAEPNLQPQLARVIGISQEQDKNEYTIIALEHNASKYGAIENDLKLEVAKTSVIGLVPIPPTNLALSDTIYKSGPTIATKLIVSWDDSQPSLRGWTVRIKRGNDNWIDYESGTPHFELPNVSDGDTYSVQVFAVNFLGKASTTGPSGTHIVVGKSLPPTDISDAYVNYNDRGVVLFWRRVDDVDLSCYEVRDGTAWETGIPLGQTSSDYMDLGPQVAGTHNWMVAALDTTGHYSDVPKLITHNVPVPAVPTSLVGAIGNRDLVLSWQSPALTYQPISGYKIYKDGVLIATTKALTYTTTVDWGGSKTFTVAAYDVAGNIGTTASYNAVVAVPSMPVISQSITGQTIKLNWQNCAGTLLLDTYEIRQGTSYATAATIGVVSAQTFSVIGNWLGTQTFWVTAKDIAGNISSEGSLNITITIPSQPSLSAAIAGDQAVMTWNVPSSTLPVVNYEVRIGATWDDSAATPPTIVNSTSYSTKVNWSGVQTLWVAAIDAAGNYGTPISTSLSISVPNTPVVTQAISGTTLTLTWQDCKTTLPLTMYEVKLDDAVISLITANTVTIPITWTGTNTYQITAIDSANNRSTAGNAAITINVPAAAILTPSFLWDQFALNWTQPAATLPIVEYVVGYGATWEIASTTGKIGTVKGTTFNTTAQWGGTRTWWITAVDQNGNIGTPASADVTITAPASPASLTQQVVDNNVLLYWSQVQGTLPTDTYEIRRGSTWDGAVVIGRKSGGFTTVFETLGGIYTYWVCAIDTAGNYGTPKSVSATISQPPDYILQQNWDSTFAGTKSNMVLDVDGAYVMPVSSTETFQQHFTDHSWTAPQNQVDAGYPIYIEPSLTNSYYEETFDYGTLLSSTKVTVTVNSAIVTGAPTAICTISVSADNINWTTYSDVLTVYGSNFRYVKVRLTVTGATSGTDLYKLIGLNVKLDAKLKNDSAMGTAGATDSVTGADAVVNGVIKTDINVTNSFGVRVPDGQGTIVLFNSPFIDISSLTVSVAAGSTAKYGIYDFLDVANPTGFKVLLYDASGTRVGGDFSWSVKGY